MSSSGNQGVPNITQPLVNLPSFTITRPWFLFFQSLWTRLGAYQGNLTVPSGMIGDFAGTVAPSGWLACDGSAVARAQYSGLFSAIGTSWGTGDGKTTFNLPNLQNVFLMGAGTNKVGSSGGKSAITLTTAQLPAHTHGVTDPGHFHASLVADSINTTGTAVGATQAGNTSPATTGITIQNTGSGAPITILPPYATVLKVIKT